MKLSRVRQVIPAIALFLISQSTGCKHRDKAVGIIPGPGITEVKFTGQHSRYNWDFQRNITKTLRLEKQVSYDGKKLLYVQYCENRLVGLDYKNSVLHFFDDSLEDQLSIGKK